MCKNWVFIMLLLVPAGMNAQEVRLYGHTQQDGKPAAAVMIMVFEGGAFYKRFVTDRKGEFRFAVANKQYTILFYKPGRMPEAYHITNHNIGGDMVKIPVNMEMVPADRSPDSILKMPLFVNTQPEVAKAYITAIYEYDRRHTSRRDTTARAIRRALVRRAVEERERFAAFKKTIARDSGSDSSQREYIVIGPDTYEMQIDARGTKKYYKNQKPVTEATYLFETTRRYEGVLKNKRDVRRFEKYRPMEHVKKVR